jgi:hypothetical protein
MSFGQILRRTIGGVVDHGWTFKARGAVKGKMLALAILTENEEMEQISLTVAKELRPASWTRM